MNIWIINPFDELPGDTDIRLRYWTICDTLAEMGHDVTWWSSNFSHRHKRLRNTKFINRDERDKEDVIIGDSALSKLNDPKSKNLSTSSPSSLLNFKIRLVPTCPYKRNVSLARLRNHRHFRWHFQNMAMEEISSGKIAPPDRMVVSLPPLGTADAAFAIRKRFGGEVILDYMDAWPETFYRLLPGFLPHPVKEFIFRPFLKAAERACRGADRISAVAQVYIDLAKERAPDKPMHLCYHGIDINRDGGDKWDRPESCSSLSLENTPLKIAYIGALERSYDLKTAIRAVHQLNREGHEACPAKPGEARVELHIAGAGTREESLKSFAQSLSSPLSLPSTVNFHGNLNRADLRSFLASCHLGLIPMRQDSFVGLPYKVADYCAAGLPVISSLNGECRRLLETKNAGAFYAPGNTDQLVEVIRNYSGNGSYLSEQSQNAHAIATGLFDRKQSYRGLAEFIEGS
ncbi:MAG: glycosyltransferase [Opitutales bacterium]